MLIVIQIPKFIFFDVVVEFLMIFSLKIGSFELLVLATSILKCHFRVIIERVLVVMYVYILRPERERDATDMFYSIVLMILLGKFIVLIRCINRT